MYRKIETALSWNYAQGSNFEVIFGDKRCFVDKKFHTFPKDFVAIKDTESFILNLRQVMEEIFIIPMAALPLKREHNSFIIVRTLWKTINL